MSATPAQVRATLENYIKAWTTKDKELLLSLFAPDGVLEDPVGTPPFKGREGIGRFWDFALQDKRRQVTPRLEEIRACGDQGILRFTMEVRIPELKQGLNLSIVEYATFNSDGQITRLAAFWDETSVSAPEGWELFAPNIDEAYAQ
jgi:steroid delta-isomerase